MKWTAPRVVVRAAKHEYQDLAASIAEQFDLPLAVDTDSSAEDRSGWELQVESKALTLSRPDGLSTAIDFVHGKAAKRARESSFASQPLARALGLQKLRKHTSTPTVIDATAGFGTDSWMIASLGSDVRLLEASPVLCAMLEHAISLADKSANTLQIINTNAVSYLNDQNNARSDVIYLDPMYPPSRNTALVKKGMQLLHELVGPDNNGAALLSAALNKADYRVVVKRPKGAALLEGSEQWTGQVTNVQSAQTRFDVYHCGVGK